MEEIVPIRGFDVEIEVVPPFSGYACCPISTCPQSIMPLRADNNEDEGGTEEGAKAAIIAKMEAHLEKSHKNERPPKK